MNTFIMIVRFIALGIGLGTWIFVYRKIDKILKGAEGIKMLVSLGAGIFAYSIASLVAELLIEGV